MNPADELRARLSDPCRKEEIAEVLGCGLNTVYEAIRRGQIPCHRLGRREYVVPRERFIRWYLGLDGEGGGEAAG